jgi:sigma-B regulation protein RsbU (phosphoserine phosphatase)
VALGDVQGKGAEAAVVTALARHTIRAAAVTQHEPSSILATLNAVLVGADTDRFCTVVLVRLRLEGDRWVATSSRGGHHPPLLRHTGEQPRPIGARGTLLGFLDEPTLFDSRHVLQPGDALLLYTDGVTEARWEDEFFGEARLEQLVAASAGAAHELVDEILEAAMRFQNHNPRDDIALVAVAVP